MSSERAGFAFRLLDAVFGFLLWAVHLLVIYIGAAMYCALASPEAVGTGGASVGLTLLGITAVALGVIGLHVARHIAPRRGQDQRFLSTLALAIDGVAAFGIAAQAIPIVMTPLCQ